MHFVISGGLAENVMEGVFKKMHLHDIFCVNTLWSQDIHLDYLCINNIVIKYLLLHILPFLIHLSYIYLMSLYISFIYCFTRIPYSL